MLVGAFYFPTDYGIAIDELARALEARGFESLFVCEHTHIPMSRRTPFPGGGELPKRYFHTHDPFVALSFAAAATRTLKLGTGIALVPQRDPVITAKQVASLDQLSDGRFIFAIGGGWNVEEMENHGARYDTRFRLLRERVLAMKALWTKEQAEFHGEFVNFDRVWLYPKPKQKPHPPIFLGGETDHTLKRVVEFCDGWFPRARGGFGLSGPHWASAQPFPNRPIKIVVPFPPGGPSDVAARLVAQPLAAKLGQTVIIENLPGAGGRTGAKAVAQASPDGYTLLLGGTNPNAIAQSIYKNLNFEPISDFTAVGVVGVDSNALVVNPAVPVSTIQRSEERRV